MKYFILFLFTAISFSGFSQSTVKVVIHSKANYQGYESFADQAAITLERVLNSPNFKTEILNGQFTETNGLSNQMIFDQIMKAHEVNGQGGQNSVVDLRVRTMTRAEDGRRWMRNCRLDSWAGTIGKDGGASGICATCPQSLELWQSTSDTASLPAHYMHEYMHILGFSHYGRKSTSLVYKVGDIIEKLVKQGI